jgi:hypothetical protein
MRVQTSPHLVTISSADGVKLSMEAHYGWLDPWNLNEGYVKKDSTLCSIKFSKNTANQLLINTVVLLAKSVLARMITSYTLQFLKLHQNVNFLVEHLRKFYFNYQFLLKRINLMRG